MSKAIHIRIPEDLKVRFDVYCAENQVTATKIILDHIKELVENKTK